MKFTVKTIGCKVNIYETNKIIQMLEDNGFEFVDIENNKDFLDLDFFIVNTCSVTSIADKKSRQILHAAKRKYKDAKIIAIGCFVDSLYLSNDTKSILKESLADVFVKNSEKDKLPDILNSYTSNAVKNAEFKDKNKHYNVRQFIKIQDGCDEFCTYCLIPYLRGRIKSRNEEDILLELKKLLLNDVKEIVLTGIHISSYGLDFENMLYENDGAIDISRKKLISLLEKVAKITVDGKTFERIRLGSLEPRIINDEFVKKLCSGELKNKFCHNFTLSLQSGSDKILKLMNRHYTTLDFENAVNIIRKFMNDVTITVDIIVGFPGETEEDFNDTLNFVKKMRFYNPNIFPYSKRKGTKAAEMENQLTNNEKHNRVKYLISVCESITKEIEEEHKANNDILVEDEIYENGKKYAIGYTKEYIKRKILL